MDNKDIYDDISSIKNIMEQSTRFISLSGLSGVLAGVYALAGSAWAYKQLYLTNAINLFPQKGENFYRVTEPYTNIIVGNLLLTAIIILVLSIGTGFYLTKLNAKKKGQSVWSESSRALLRNGSLPLLAGGIFILILLFQGNYGVLAPASLIFYGLALVAASNYTYGDVKWLGLTEIVLGLLATIAPAYGLWFWALGFGVMHVIYGTAMYFKYDRENSAG